MCGVDTRHLIVSLQVVCGVHTRVSVFLISLCVVLMPVFTICVWCLHPFTEYFAGRDLGKSGDDADKYFGLIWIAAYAHVLIKQFGDLYTTDGTHKISYLGWRAVPYK